MEELHSKHSRMSPVQNRLSFSLWFIYTGEVDEVVRKMNDKLTVSHLFHRHVDYIIPCP